MAQVLACTVHDDIVVWRHCMPDSCGNVGECDLQFFGNVKWDGQWMVDFSGTYVALARSVRRAERYDVLLPFYGLDGVLDEFRAADANTDASRRISELRVRLPSLVRGIVREHLRTMILRDPWPASLSADRRAECVQEL
jgi:hypothetical protein